MGDLDLDTTVTGGDGRYRAVLSRDWEIWGPNGGYVASVALRAAGAHSTMTRPAAFSCHYLAVAGFDEVQLEVSTLRAARRAESVGVTMTQGDRRILDGLAWIVADDGEGLVHDHASMPEVKNPDELPFIQDLLPPDAESPFRFWQNFEHKPLHWVENWEEREPGEPASQGWYRYHPRATFDDPFVDAARSLILLDTMSWPAAVRAHSGQLPYIAPSLDLAVQFHRRDPAVDWLLADGFAPVAEDGLIGFNSRVWTPSGRLLASASGQLLCRKVPVP